MEILVHWLVSSDTNLIGFFFFFLLLFENKLWKSKTNIYFGERERERERERALKIKKGKKNK